jgi:hypothetical protein
MTDNPTRHTDTGSVPQGARCGAKTRSGAMQVGAGCRAAEVSNARGC